RSIYRRDFRAYYYYNSHDKKGNDLIFLNNTSSLIATGGESSNNKNVNILDILYTNSNRCIMQSYECFEGHHCNCLEYCKNISCIVAGGNKGLLYMIDPRKNKYISKWNL